MPRGTRYRLECLIRPFFEARLFFLSLAFPVFTFFLSSLSPCGSPRGPGGSALSLAFRISFRHSSLHLGPYQTTALQEIPIDGANCAPPLLDSWTKSNLGSQLTCIVGLSFLFWVILGRDSIRSLFSLALLTIFPSPSSSLSLIFIAN